MRPAGFRQAQSSQHLGDGQAFFDGGLKDFSRIFHRDDIQFVCQFRHLGMVPLAA